MANEVQIILTAVDKASAVLKDTDKATQSLGQTLKTVATSAAVAAAAYKGFEVLKGAVVDTVKYAESVRDLSRALGVSAEESSTLIQVADDLKIPIDTLKMGFKKALMEGVQPNIEGIKGLAVQYQQLTSPVEKAQFSMQYFGRAGLELNKILELTPGELDAMAQSAQDAGLIMSGEGVQAARDYEIALDNLEDSAMGLKLTVGKELIPILSDLAIKANELIGDYNDLASAEDTVKTAMDLGIITAEEKRDLMRQLMLGTANMTEVDRIASQVEDQLTEDRYEGIIATQKMRTAVDGATEATDALTAAENATKAAQDALNEASTKFGAQMVFNKAAMNLTTEEALNLGVKMGVLDSKTILANAAMANLQKSLDEGKITAAEYALKVKALYDWIEKLHDKEITITTILRQVDKTGEPKSGRQFGGPVSSGMPYIVGEAGPELFVPSSSGTIINNYNLTAMYQNRDRQSLAMDIKMLAAMYG